MANIWNTQNKRILAMVSMGISGWYTLSQTMEAVPALPKMLIDPIGGSVSALAIAGGFTLFSIYLLWDSQING